jgi:peptide/nickel transport system permease protein
VSVQDVSAVAVVDAGTASPVSASGGRVRGARRPVVVVCLFALLVLAAIAILAPILLPDIAGQRSGDLLHVREAPSGQHLLGTDTQGRDVLERLLVGTRVTLVGVVEGVAAALLLGVPIGLAAGYFRGRLDKVVGWVAELAMSVPAIVIVVQVLSIFRGSLLAAMLVFGALTAPGLMRVVRSVVIQVREELYVSAAVVAGLTAPYILFRHVLPRIRGVLVVQGALLAAAALVVQTGLAFLGLLVSPPAPSWGEMVADGLGVIVLQPWLIWPPGIAIVLTVLAFGFLADSFTDRAEVVRTPGRRRGASRQGVEAAARPGGTGESVRMHGTPLLSVEDLRVAISGTGGSTRILDGVTFSIAAGEAVGLVGESGCGKSITAAAIMRLLPAGGVIESGKVELDGQRLSSMTEKDLRALRGRDIGFVAQEPMIALNPAMRIGDLLGEVVRLHHGGSKAEVRRRVLELLDSVHLPNPSDVARRYPHELSGGMAQRVSIARALAGEPKLLIADEPTTALDVTVQAEILQLLRELRESRGMALLLVTHDWGVVADICDRAVVMYAGQVVETAAVDAIFTAPKHPYSKRLLESDPHRADKGALLPTIPGTVPPPGQWPVGCRFAPRCPFALARCSDGDVVLEQATGNHLTRCIRRHELEELNVL